jgi:DUF4097 and DUF4098 domain-containing protein YvlB
MSNGRRRRGSIFGGMLLILVGVLFLLHYWTPSLVHLERIAQYWPVLLILWGLARIYDHFAAQRTGEAAPRLMTGGEFLLLLLVLLTAGAAIGHSWLRKQNIAWEGPIGIFQQPYKFTDELPAVTVQPGSQIVIVTPRGDLTVRAEDTPTLRVIVTKTVNANNEKEAQQRARQVSVAIHEVSGGYRVEPGEQGDNRDVRISLEVHVPKQAKISAKTDRGDIEISDVEGPINASSGKGDIEIHNAGSDIIAEVLHGDARITGVKGNLTVTGAGGELELGDVTGTTSIDGEFYGPIRVRNVAKTTHFLSARTDLTISALPGRMEMDSSRLGVYDASGSVLLTTRNKDVEMENVGGRIQVVNRHVNIEVRFQQPPHDEISITNDSGNVDLVLPPKSSCEIAAVSHSGDVVCDFNEAGLKQTQENDSSKLTGKLGTRGPKVSIFTSYGTIHIRRAA